MLLSLNSLRQRPTTRPRFNHTRSNSSSHCLFIDVLVTCIQFIIDQGDAPHYLGRLFRHILSGGFIYLDDRKRFSLDDGWSYRASARIGSAATGLPNLNPRHRPQDRRQHG